jgi:hypothetical protein
MKKILKINGFEILVDEELFTSDDIEISEALQKLFQKASSVTYKDYNNSIKVQNKMEDLHQGKRNTSRDKILKSMHTIRLEKGKLSEYNISKVSGCSINTVKKNRNFIGEHKQEFKLKYQYEN